MFRINSRCISCGTCWQFDPELRMGVLRLWCASSRVSLGVASGPVGAQACPVAAIEASAEQRDQRPDDGFPVP